MTFYNTMLSRMSYIKAGRMDDPETGESLSDVETTLRGLGIELRESETEFRNFGEVLDEVASKWDSFSSVSQRAIATAFAGTRQQTRFLALMQGYAQAEEYSAAAADSAGMSAQKLAIYQESVEAKTNRATAAFENFSMTLLDSNIIGGIMDFGTGLFNALAAFDAWPAKIGIAIAAITTLKGLFDTLKGANVIQNIAKSFSSLAERTGMIGPSNWIIAAGQCKEAA